MSPLRLAGALALSVVAAACGNNDAPLVTSPTAATLKNAQFTGVIDPGGRRYYSFTLSTSGNVVATLASVTNADTGAPLPIPLRLGIGRPQGTECPPTSAVTVAAALQPQLTELTPEGVSCLDVADVGSATTPIRFSVRFTYP